MNWNDGTPGCQTRRVYTRQSGVTRYRIDLHTCAEVELKPVPFIPTNDAIEIDVEGQLSGQDTVTKFYLLAAGAPTPAMLEEVAGITAAWIAAHQLPNTANNYQATRVIAKDISEESGAQFTNIDNAGEPGATPNPLPNNVTFAVHRNTGFGGKKSKSRIYWPGIASSYVSSPVLVTETAANNMVNACDSLRTALQAGIESTYEYGYISFVNDGLPRANGVFVPVTGHSYTDLRIDSQKRRLAGRGR